MDPAMMEKMTGEQLSGMFKMQRDLLKRDPAKFRSMMPPAAQAMSDDMLLTQINAMAEMDPSSLKSYMSMTNRFGSVVNKVGCLCYLVFYPIRGDFVQCVGTYGILSSDLRLHGGTMMRFHVKDVLNVRHIYFVWCCHLISVVS
jgi:hypothetical protein